MRSLEKIFGEAVSSIIILIVGFMIVSELAKISPALQGIAIALKITFGLLTIAIGIKVFDYFRR